MIPGVPSMGGLELVILLAIILMFFGAKRIPELARSLGKGTREFRKGLDEGEEEGSDKGEEKGSDKAEVRERNAKEESPAPEGAYPEDGRVPEGEKPKAGPSARA